MMTMEPSPPAGEAWAGGLRLLSVFFPACESSIGTPHPPPPRLLPHSPSHPSMTLHDCETLLITDSPQNMAGQGEVAKSPRVTKKYVVSLHTTVEPDPFGH